MSAKPDLSAPHDAGSAGGADSAGRAVRPDGWEAVIGLETHVQLNTRTKMFCGCKVTFGEPPNTHVCPVCLGHPGVLPVTNERVVEYATRVALALNCRIAERTIFHRKNYFYPDLPKAYQISQYDLPLGIGGYMDVELEDGSILRVGITRVHLEEDAGKLVHAGGASGRIDGADYSLVDFNRGGTPLVEIVSEPDLSTPDQARAYLTQLRNLIEQLGVSDVNMEEGSVRCDVNVSVRRPGEPFGTKTELKNMNSFRFVHRGLEAEIERQVDALESGERIVQETVHFDPATGTVSTLRSKEEAHDYRYFPEPDLTPIELDETYVERVRAGLPELPAARKERLIAQYGLPPKDAALLAANKPLGDYFESLAAATGDARTSANWVLGDLSAYLNAAGLEVTQCPVGVEALAELLGTGDRWVPLRQDGQRGVRGHDHHRQERQRDRGRQGAGSDLRHGRARSHRGPARSRQPGSGRGIPAGARPGAGFLRRAGDEGDPGSSEPSGGQRTAPEAPGGPRRMTGAVGNVKPPSWAPAQGPRKVENRAHVWYLALPFLTLDHPRKAQASCNPQVCTRNRVLFSEPRISSRASGLFSSSAIFPKVSIASALLNAPWSASAPRPCRNGSRHLRKRGSSRARAMLRSRPGWSTPSPAWDGILSPSSTTCATTGTSGSMTVAPKRVSHLMTTWPVRSPRPEHLGPGGYS